MIYFIIISDRTSLDYIIIISEHYQDTSFYGKYAFPHRTAPRIEKSEVSHGQSGSTDEGRGRVLGAREVVARRNASEKTRAARGRY